MSKKSKHKIILIGGIRYYADKPDTCRNRCLCFKTGSFRRGICAVRGRPGILRDWIRSRANALFLSQ
ncbi:hypothetical protein, partial [uncultured Subdoligranulum sp.]|uniref:hypothetical protein n=1 Tax=uncultured Subdoligranulum sp. TaxID=512298 RepID=UPI0025E0E696